VTQYQVVAQVVAAGGRSRWSQLGFGKILIFHEIMNFLPHIYGLNGHFSP
jgi:hypothetical protein